MSNVKCAEGFSVKEGGKTIHFTNNAKNIECLVVNLISATWDHTQKEWGPGKTYTLTLKAAPGETVSGLLGYEGCGKGRNYAAAYQIGITGQAHWLYKMSHNDPYYANEPGNSNDTITIVSDEYNQYTAEFSNSND